jgi:CubicO group peptidase (beta-lactamase class C family)
MNRYLPPLLLTAIYLTACQPNASLPNTPVVITAPNTIGVDAAVRSWVAENNFNGVIAVGQGAETTYILPTGAANHQTGQKLTGQTVFQTGSVDKLFASIIVFALAERGKLDLDAPISTYLGDEITQDRGDITLAHLLSNRSGLPASFRPVMGQMMGGLKANPDATLTDLGLDMTLAEAVARFGHGNLSAQPDTAFDYVYANWVYVHLILETVTGATYSELLSRYVFDPVGATRSGVFDMTLEATDVGDEDFAVGFDADDDFHTGDFPIPPMLGGGSYTSAENMVRIFDGVYGGELLSAESLKRFSTLTTSDENYAYGGRVMTYKSSPDALYSWQSGSNGATNMVAVHSIETGYSFIALSNTAHSQDDMFALSRVIELNVEGSL